MSFFVSNPLPNAPFKINSFTTSGDVRKFYAGEEVVFNWGILGSPKRALIIYGDGNIDDITKTGKVNNAIYSGSNSHSYELQGKYFTILQIWDNWNHIITKNFEILIENDPPLFNIAINDVIFESRLIENLKLSDEEYDYSVSEDEEVKISVENLDKDKVTLSITNLKYIFDFGSESTSTSQNSTTYSWSDSGIYPLTVTILGEQGELSKQTLIIKVVNDRPKASFNYKVIKQDERMKKIQFNGELSSDAPSDLSSLRFLWEWGDGSYGWGKYASHEFYNFGSQNVTLTVKDDNGEIDSISRTISFNNTIPDVSLGLINASFGTFKEGDLVQFLANADDDDKDIFELKYYWNFNSKEFNSTILEEYDLGGWKNLHYFEDDFNGNVTVGVVDTSNQDDFATIPINILNANPEIHFIDLSVIANISFQVVRTQGTGSSNFTFKIKADDEFITKSVITCNKTEETIFNSTSFIIPFSLTKNWFLIANSSDKIPQDTNFMLKCLLKFIDGQESIIESPLLQSNESGNWLVELSSSWYDAEHKSFKVPLSLRTQVHDPSIDEIDFEIGQEESKLLEIECSNFPSSNTTLSINGINYSINFITLEAKKFVNITAKKQIHNEHLGNRTFSAVNTFEDVLSPLIDVQELLTNKLGLFDLEIINYTTAINLLRGGATDDDLGTFKITYIFDTLNTLVCNEFMNPFDSLNYEQISIHPYALIGSFCSEVQEGESVNFVSKSDVLSDLYYYWDFSDGTFAFGKNAKHSWNDAGIYNVTLIVADCFGNTYTNIRNITITPKAPEIVGPISFQGIENTALTLDVEIHDTDKDDPKLQYRWFDENDKLFSTEPKPTVFLDDGSYEYKLMVKDPSGHETIQDINIIIHPRAPQLSVASYMYYGLANEGLSTSTENAITLRAYALDDFHDGSNLVFHWIIKNKGEVVGDFEDSGNGYLSEVTFSCKETTIYQGEVHVIDKDGKEKVSNFQINSVIDSTLNGVNDEFESMVRSSPSDTDGDHLTDDYEIYTSFTNYTDPDTDDDLLYDGYDDYNIGEQPLGTDPLDWDTDDDNLSDGREYFGWNITITYFENTTTFLVTSDPLDNDTDNDGLDDYEEYTRGTNPRSVNSDNDDLDDIEDPNPTSWDGDNDLLSDSWELEHGTDPTNPDTDNDGLKDGEEVYGWGNGFYTNPLDADTDHDFASDSAEIRNYLIKLQENGFDDLDMKVNLSIPVSLNFPYHFEQAAAAQISFGLSYGEYGENATGSYGIPDEDISDLSILLTKPSDNILLANFTTNSTRYFSQVVDVSSIMNNETLDYDYYGEYQIGVGIVDPTPVAGYYYGTYSFNDDEDGTVPYGWTVTDSRGGTCQVIDEIGNHAKVVEFHDTSNYFEVHLETTFSSQNTGTIEYWWRASSTAGGQNFLLLDNSNCLAGLGLGSGYIQYYDPTGWHNIMGLNANQWYHLKLVFDSGTDKYSVYIDGELKVDNADYHVSGNGVNKINMNTGGSIYGIYTYLDAVGFSWDTNYECGDNTEEYMKPYRYLESGDYPGTYSFDNDEDGTVPNGWTLSENRGGTCQVIDEMGNHAKVVEFHDTSNYFEVHLETSFAPQNIGTVEWWWRATATSSCQNLLFYDNLANLFGIQFHSSGYIQYQTPSGWSNIKTYNANQWYHFRIDFNSLTDIYNVYIDGIQEVTDASYKTSGCGVEKLFSATGSSAYNFYSYFDAISFSWDPSYTIGLNKLSAFNNFYLEYFELEFCRYLDPNDPDTDNDGILDGVEMGSLVDGTDIIDFRDSNSPSYPIIPEISWWDFEEGSGTQANDRSGNNDGTISGATWISGMLGNYSLSLDGINDYVNVGDPVDESLDFGTGDFSINLWVRAPDQDFASMVSKGDHTLDTGWSFDINADGTIRLMLQDSSNYEVVSTESIDDESWHMITAVRNGDYLRIYIDSVINGTASGCDSVSVSSSTSFKVGCRSGSAPSYFEGIVDDVRMYNYSLDEYEVSWLFSENSGSEDPLIHYYYSQPIFNLTMNGSGNFNTSNIGRYPGSYSFEGEIGETSENIDLIDVADIPTGTSCRVISSLGDHKDVLELDDDSSTDAVEVDDVLPSAQTKGTIELWMRTTDISVETYVRGVESGAIKIYMGFRGNCLKYHNGAGWQTIQAVTNNKWYHVRIEFDCTTDTHDIYVDGILRTSGGSFYASATQISTVRLTTSNTPSGYTSYFDAIGYSWDSNYELGDNHVHEPIPLELSTTHVISIPQIGIVYDADVTFELESVETPQGTGDVVIQLYKNPLNQTLEDEILYNDYTTYSTTPFSYSKTINLKNLLCLDTFYGEFLLTIALNGTNPSDRFNLTKLEIETDTFIQAEFGDSEAWITDPALEDTDGDGWDDHVEIFTEGTSPVSVDSDGDDSWDPNDRDPLKDVMLEIHPTEGVCANLWYYESHALMQISVALEFGENDYCVITPIRMATKTLHPVLNKYQRAYFDEYYYINIDDDMTRQGSTISLNLQLWHLLRSYGWPDEAVIDVDRVYTITQIGQPVTTFNVVEQGYFQRNDLVEVEVKTVGIDKANTLAVYEANTTFTGHYQDINQRYAVIQLHIPDEGHYLGSESFLNDQVGNCSTEIGFITSDSSGRESCTKIVEEIDGHTKVLQVQEQSDDKHADFYHAFSSSKSMGTIEWWWRTNKISGGIVYVDIRYGTTDVMRFYLRDGKIKYHDGSYHDVMSASSDTWYHMKLVFAGKVGIEEIYKFDLYVDGQLKINDGNFVSDQNSINRIGIVTSGDVCSGYFDAFGFSWDSDYSVGDNLHGYDCDGTPFQPGVNVIVIPTERFTETLLHRHLEQGMLSSTPLYHPDKYVFEFVSNERDGTIDEANSDVDFFFMRRNISPEDAMEVLELVIRGLINESLDESNNTIYTIGWINEYVSTKLNGTKATELNLPYSVLGYIPWFNSYKSSKMGDEPEPDGGFNLILWLLCMANPILNDVLAMAMAMTGGEIFAYLKEYCENVFMNVLTTVGDLLWTLIRAAMYILTYVVLALTILDLVIEFTMYMMIIPIILLLEGTVNVGFWFFEYTLNYKTFRQSAQIEWDNDDYFDMDFPSLVRSDTINGDITSYSKEGIIIQVNSYYTKDLEEDINDSEKYYSNDGESWLSSPSISQINGDTETRFIFKIKYTDIYNRAPNELTPLVLLIKNLDRDIYFKQYLMQNSEENDGNYDNGEWYEIELEIDILGTYEYAFTVGASRESQNPATIITNKKEFKISDVSPVDASANLLAGYSLAISQGSGVILALLLGTVLPKAYEQIFSYVMLGIYITALLTELILLSLDEEDATTFRSWGMALGLMILTFYYLICSQMKLDYSKLSDSKGLFKKVTNIIKFVSTILSLIVSSIGNLISNTFEIDFVDLIFNSIGASIATLTMIFTLPLAASAIHGTKYIDQVEQATKTASYGIMITSFVFGILFSFITNSLFLS